MLFLLPFLMTCMVPVVLSNWIQTPRNTVGVPGQNITFHCNHVNVSQSGVNWYLEDQAICDTYGGCPAHTGKYELSGYHLDVFGLKPENAAPHGCRVTWAQEMAAAALLYIRAPMVHGVIHGEHSESLTEDSGKPESSVKDSELRMQRSDWLGSLVEDPNWSESAVRGSDWSALSNENPKVSVEEGVVASLYCRASYAGVWPPVITWTAVIIGDISDVTRAENVTSFFTFRPSKGDIGEMVQCETRFDTPPGDYFETGVTYDIVDNEPPDWSENLKMTLDVQFSVTDIEVKLSVSDMVISDKEYLQNETLRVGDFIVCTGDGNPEPEFSWKRVSGPPASLDDNTGKEARLNATRDMIGYNEYVCFGSNTVIGRRRDAEFLLAFTVSKGVELSATFHMCILPAIYSYFI